MGPISAEVEIDVPRERAFELIGDLAARPSFTDHFLSDFHLTRIESAGVGAGARFRVEAPLRSIWMDTTIVELEEPHRIVEHGQGGRVNRIRANTVWELTGGPRLADHGPLLPLDRADQPPGPGPGGPQRRPPSGRSAAGARRCAGCATCSSPTTRPASGSPSPGATDTRPASLNRLSPPMSPNRRFVLPLLAALALGVLALGVSACGYSSDSKDVAEGEAVHLGDLQFNVVFSRYLNPNDSEDSAYLVGQPPPPERLHLLRRLLPRSRTKATNPQTLPSTLTITDATNATYDVIPSESLYAFPFGGEVESEEQIPVLDSTPQQGPIEGSLALFLLPAEASDNRPLTLHIPGAEGEDAKVTLDL